MCDHRFDGCLHTFFTGFSAHAINVMTTKCEKYFVNNHRSTKKLSFCPNNRVFLMLRRKKVLTISKKKEIINERNSRGISGVHLKSSLAT